MKIRIGNDIRINLTVRGPLDYTFANVKLIKCLLINECMTVGCNCCDGDRCAIQHRFPHEPFPQYYTPTPYTLNVCGHPRYHTDPWNCKACYRDFGGHFNDYHWWPGYHGFGLHPRKFIGDCCRFHMNHAMDIFYCDPRPCPYHHGCGHHCDHHCDCCIDKDFIYNAKAALLSGQNKVQCMFPAYDQIMCGSYKLVLVITTYEQGWGCRNLHTETIDYGTLFELVDDESGQLGSITIDADNLIQDDSTLSSITIASQNDSPSYTFISGTTVKMGTSDLNGDIWQIIATTKDGRLVPYSANWGFDKLTFISSNPDILSIDENGTMTIGSPDEDVTITVTIIDNENQSVSTLFDILVKASGETGVGYKLWMQYQAQGGAWSNTKSTSPVYITLAADQLTVDFKIVRLTKNGNEVHKPYTIKLAIQEDSMLKYVVIEDDQSYLQFDSVYMNTGDTVKHCTFTYTDGTDSASIQYIITKEAPTTPIVDSSHMHIVAPIWGTDTKAHVYNPTTRPVLVDIYIEGENMSDSIVDGFTLYEVDEEPTGAGNIEDHIVGTVPFEVISTQEDGMTEKNARIQFAFNQTAGNHYYLFIYNNAEYSSGKWDSEPLITYYVLSQEEISQTVAGGMLTGVQLKKQNGPVTNYRRGVTEVYGIPTSDIYYQGCELSTDYGEIDYYMEVVAHSDRGDSVLIGGVSGIVADNLVTRIIQPSIFDDISVYCVSVKMWGDYNLQNTQVEPIGDPAVLILFYRSERSGKVTQFFYNDPRFNEINTVQPLSGSSMIVIKDCSLLNLQLHQPTGKTRRALMAADGSILSDVNVPFDYDYIESSVDYIINDDSTNRYESEISTGVETPSSQLPYATIDGVKIYPMVSIKPNSTEKIWHIGFIIEDWDNRTSDDYTSIPDFMKGHNITYSILELGSNG